MPHDLTGFVALAFLGVFVVIWLVAVALELRDEDPNLRTNHGRRLEMARDEDERLPK